MKTQSTNPAQMGFDSLLASADEANDRHFFLKTVAHLPGAWTEAVPFYRALLESHHNAIIEGNDEEVCHLKTEAYDLAVKLNDGVSLGICAPDGYGTKLEEEAAAAEGDIPKWGRAGNFIIDQAWPSASKWTGCSGSAASMISGRASEPMRSIAASHSSAIQDFAALPDAVIPNLFLA